MKSSKIILTKTSKTLCNGIWQKQLLILKFEQGFFVDLVINYRSSQCQVKLWKLIQNWAKMTKNSFKFNRLHRLDNKPTLPFILENFHIHLPWNIWNVHPLMDPISVKSDAVEDSTGLLNWSINVFVVELAAMSVVGRVTTSNPWLWTLDKASSLDPERSALLRVKDILFWCSALADF